MPDNPFDGPKSVLKRAREHIDDLNTKGKVFADCEPYARFCELDIPAAQYLYGFRLTKSIPDSLSTVAKDALSNLKDVLDLAVCATVRMFTPSTTVEELSGICFPFADKEESFPGALKRGCEKIEPEIRAIISSFKPYRGGNDHLYIMNVLTRTNRHRIVQPVLLAAENSMVVNFMSGKNFSAGPYGWDSGKNKLVIIRADNPNVKYDVSIALHVAFGDIEIVSGQPAVPILYSFASEVERILMALEAETNRVLASRT